MRETAVEQISAFGTLLHVSSRDAEALAEVVKRHDRPGYEFASIDTGLEDVFLYLMKQHEEQVAL